MSARAYSSTQLIYRAYRALGGLRPGQGASSDTKNDCLDSLNDMVDAWQIDRRKIFCIRIDAYNFTSAYAYTIGPGGDFNTGSLAKPNEIEDANCIITTTSPVTRQAIDPINYDQWASIRVQQIPNSIPTKLYYDKGFDANARGTIHVWPGAIAGYQLELFTTQQLTQFADLTTSYILPPGYANAIMWSLAEMIYPLMKIYLKIEPDMAAVVLQARRARAAIESANAPNPLMVVDIAMKGNQQRGAFSYLTGGFNS